MSIQCKYWSLQAKKRVVFHYNFDLINYQIYAH